MPSYKEIYTDRWLTADHLKERDVTITISFCGLEEYYDKQAREHKQQLAAHFKGRDIMLSLNRTRCQALEAITGTDDWALWRNVRVTLRPGIAPNKKATIIIVAPPPAAPATPVHGRADDIEKERAVHGRAQAAPAQEGVADPVVHGPLHGQQPSWHEDVAFNAAAPAAAPESEEMSDEADPKSQGDGRPSRPPDADGLFFSESDLISKVRSCHQESNAPMTIAQYEFLEKLLYRFSGGKDVDTIWLALMGREVTRDERPGERVGRYLFDLMRDDQRPWPDESAALQNLVERL